MTKEQVSKLKNLHESGCTDSTIEDFCIENNLSFKEVFHLIAEWSVPECCNGCKNISMFPSMFPCLSCSRGKRDLYEKEV